MRLTTPEPDTGPATDGHGAARGQAPLVLESCHSTWIFDRGQRRFRRILKDLDLDPVDATTEWRPYERLEVDEGSDSFVVVLNAAGTRRIRSWRHGEGCVQCAGQPTTEMAVDDLLHVLGRSSGV
jgi:hypothetical protein